MNITIALLSPAEADALRNEAQQVLLSIRRRSHCTCDRVIRASEGGNCFKCGKWIHNPSAERFLRRDIDALYELGTVFGTERQAA